MRSCRARAVPEFPEGAGARPSHSTSRAQTLFGAGRIMPQSRASMLVARALAPKPGERVLDLCAAPGAKTTHLGGAARATTES